MKECYETMLRNPVMKQSFTTAVMKQSYETLFHNCHLGRGLGRGERQSVSARTRAYTRVPSCIEAAIYARIRAASKLDV